MECIVQERPATAVKTFTLPDPTADQLDLFGDLMARVMLSPLIKHVRPARRKPKRKPQVQAIIEFREPDDIPEDGDFPAHRVIAAGNCKPPETRAFRSVWDLATATPNPAKRPSLRMERAAESRQILRRIERGETGLRHTAVREQDTDEWREREERRRARQRPPKPPRQAFKMKNSRVFSDAGEK